MYGNVVINDLKNKEEGVNTSSRSSHVKIWVDCLNCKETFLRRSSALRGKHRCIPNKIVDGVMQKWCNDCKQFKNIEEFGDNLNTSDKHGRECKLCRKTRSKKDRSLFSRQEATNEVLIKRVFHNKKLDKNFQVGDDLIDLEFLIKLWNLQENLCYYTKIPMTLRTKGALHSASLDRIDSSKGYTKQNTVWCTRAVNFMKNDSSIGELLNFIEKWDFCKSFNPIRAEHKLLHPDAKTPTKSRDTDAGHDLYSIENVIIQPGTTINVRTGIILTVPNNYYITVEGRSSLFKNGVIPARGIIDATYTGELIVALTNQSHKEYKIEVGDRVAQFIVHKCYDIDITMVDDFSPQYNVRGTAGYGSSGK